MALVGMSAVALSHLKVLICQAQKVVRLADLFLVLRLHLPLHDRLPIIRGVLVERRSPAVVHTLDLYLEGDVSNKGARDASECPKDH